MVIVLSAAECQRHRPPNETTRRLLPLGVTPHVRVCVCERTVVLTNIVVMVRVVLKRVSVTLIDGSVLSMDSPSSECHRPICKDGTHTQTRKHTHTRSRSVTNSVGWKRPIIKKKKNNPSFHTFFSPIVLTPKKNKLQKTNRLKQKLAQCENEDCGVGGQRCVRLLEANTRTTEMHS